MTPQTIQKMLDENNYLIQCIMDCQSIGITAECTQYQQILERNLVFLATIADPKQNVQSFLPIPHPPNMGMGQNGSHPSGNINDNMTSELPPMSMIQSHVSVIQPQSGTPHYSAAQTGGQHYYQIQPSMGMRGQGSQGMSQKQMGSCHTSQPGHGEYSYRQSSYGDQGYERSSDESSQHYYVGNSQYRQQQNEYQQGTGQQSYSAQSYDGPPQGYGPNQGSSSQYSQYQQSQQYGSYHPSQEGGPAQRPYPYEQDQYRNYQQ